MIVHSINNTLNHFDTSDWQGYYKHLLATLYPSIPLDTGTILREYTELHPTRCSCKNIRLIIQYLIMLTCFRASGTMIVRHTRGRKQKACNTYVTRYLATCGRSTPSLDSGPCFLSLHRGDPLHSDRARRGNKMQRFSHIQKNIYMYTSQSGCDCQCIQHEHRSMLWSDIRPL